MTEQKTTAFQQLAEFITKKMRMSHLYQPLMLRTLIERGGVASLRDIASAFLAHDESQIEYYTEIIKRMPGPVLTRHHLVRRDEHIDNAMSKDFRFAYQRETRFLWAGLGRTATGFIDLELGPLTDIATLVDAP